VTGWPASWGRPGCRAPARAVTVLVAAALAWQGLWALGVLPRQFMPSAAQAIGTLLTLAGGALLAPLGQTLLAWLLGFLIACAAGITIGIGIGLSEVMSALLAKVIRFARPVPPVALIPAVILIAGVGLSAKVLLVTVSAVWPVLFNVAYSVREVPAGYVEIARTLRVSRAQIIRRVILPAALPGALTGIRIAVAIALAVTVGSELLMGDTGLGYYISTEQTAAQDASAYAAVVLAGVVGVLLSALIILFERRVTFWSTERR
jgi:ABC-type nitrate/sulfonate/bicarbonate transport system permease component